MIYPFALRLEAGPRTLASLGGALGCLGGRTAAPEDAAGNHPPACGAAFEPYSEQLGNVFLFRCVSSSKGKPIHSAQVAPLPLASMPWLVAKSTSLNSWQGGSKEDRHGAGFKKGILEPTNRGALLAGECTGKPENHTIWAQSTTTHCGPRRLPFPWLAGQAGWRGRHLPSVPASDSWSL